MAFRRSFVAATAVLGVSALVAGSIATALAAPGAGDNRAGNRAGGRQGGGRRQPPIVQALATLNLSEEQKTKTQAIVQKFQADQRALSPQDRRTKGRELQQQMLKDVNAVLTAEQQATLKREMAKRNGPLNAVVRDLALTDEQRPKIMPLVESAHLQIANINDDQSTQGRERREKVQTVIQDTVAKMKPLLTAEQQTKLDTAVAEMGRRGNGGNAGNNRRNNGNGNTPP
jgi:Spy/CpxP family protein refolding chaperone